jgi:hypothetical protein
MDDMTPGPELDALVAEKMGCKLLRKREALLAAKDQAEYERIRGLDEYRCRCADMAHMGDDGEGLNRYSQEIGPAWEVAAKASIFRLEKQWEFNEAHWWCEFGSDDYGDMSCTATSESAPHAICLAFLKLVGA